MADLRACRRGSAPFNKNTLPPDEGAREGGLWGPRPHDRRRAAERASRVLVRLDVTAISLASNTVHCRILHDFGLYTAPVQASGRGSAPAEHPYPVARPAKWRRAVHRLGRHARSRALMARNWPDASACPLVRKRATRPLRVCASSLSAMEAAVVSSTIAAFCCVT